MELKFTGMNRAIVIIEDEREIADSLARFLRSRSFDVRLYPNGEVFLADSTVPVNCLYLIDWNLPGIKGIDLVRTIRGKDKLSPVFMISGYSRSEEVVAGLGAGADDYITKPFNFNELGIRVENAWAKLQQLEANILHHGLKLIPEAHIVMRDGVSVSLTAREYIIFNRLHGCQPDASTRQEIIGCFNSEEKMTARNVDVHVFSLRKKMTKLGIKIETVWGVGYKLTVGEAQSED